MNATVSLYSMENEQISNFLNKFYTEEIYVENILEWKKIFANPIEIANIIGVFIDNNENFKINMWVALDEGISINVNDNNANQLIKYLYERFPY